MPCWVTTSRSVWFNWLIVLAFQNQAISLWSGVRTVLFSAPYTLVSLRSVAYCALASGGGGGARDCAELVSRNGCMDASQGVCADCSDGGGANTHKPGAGSPRAQLALPVAWWQPFARRAPLSAGAAP